MHRQVTILIHLVLNDSLVHLLHLWRLSLLILLNLQSFKIHTLHRVLLRLLLLTKIEVLIRLNLHRFSKHVCIVVLTLGVQLVSVILLILNIVISKLLFRRFRVFAIKVGLLP